MTNNSNSIDDLEAKLWTSFNHITAKMALYEDDDERYSKLAIIQQRLAASILQCNESRNKQPGSDSENEFAKLLEKIAEDERLSQEEKKAMMSIKDAHSSKLR